MSSPAGKCFIETKDGLSFQGLQNIHPNELDVDITAPTQAELKFSNNKKGLNIQEVLNIQSFFGSY